MVKESVKRWLMFAAVWVAVVVVVSVGVRIWALLVGG